MYYRVLQPHVIILSVFHKKDSDRWLKKQASSSVPPRRMAVIAGPSTDGYVVLQDLTASGT